MFLEQQISKTGVMMLKIQITDHVNKLHLQYIIIENSYFKLL